MVSNYFNTAFKVGPIAIVIFIISFSILSNDLNDVGFLLFVLVIGGFITTIVAFIASVIVYGAIERFISVFQLSLSAKESFYYFLPVLVFLFGIPLLFQVWLGTDVLVTAISITSFFSAQLGWCLFCFSKVKSEQSLFHS